MLIAAHHDFHQWKTNHVPEHERLAELDRQLDPSAPEGPSTAIRRLQFARSPEIDHGLSL